MFYSFSGVKSITINSGLQKKRSLGAYSRSMPIPRETNNLAPPGNMVSPAAQERGIWESVTIGPINGTHTWPPWVCPAINKSPSIRPSAKFGT